MKQQIYFVTGKGGVGKSAYAAALALHFVKKKAKVLLVELGETSFYQDYLQIPSVTFNPQKTNWGFDLAQWSGKDCLQEYAQHLIKVETLVKLFFENRVMRTFVDIAPGLQELAIMGKATSLPRRHGPPIVYDYIIIDCFATGHFKALMEAPRGMAKGVPVGPMGEQSRGIEKILKDPKICHYHVVTLAEELPLKESVELKSWLLDEFKINAQLITNKRIHFPFAPEALKKASGEDAKLFAEYLITQDQAQQMAMEKYLSAQDQTTIPWFFENDGVEVVKNMSEKIKRDEPNL